MNEEKTLRAFPLQHVFQRTSPVSLTTLASASTSTRPITPCLGFCF